MKPVRHGWRRTSFALSCAAALTLLSSCGGGGSGNGELEEGGTSIPNAGRQYFPLAVGDRWVYRQWSGESGAGSEIRLLKATGTETVNGREAMLVRAFRALDGFEEGVQYLTVTDTGVTLLANPASQPEDLPIAALEQMRFPLTAGSSHVQLDKTFDMGADYDGDGRNETLRIVSGVSVVGFGSVQTDLKSFVDAAHLQTIVTQTGIYSSGRTPVTVTSAVDSWYAPGVGLVREDTVTSGAGSTSSSHVTIVGYSVGGVRSESSYPTATLVSPSSRNVQNRFTQIQLSYSEPMDISTMDAAAIELRDPMGMVVPVYAYREASNFNFYSANGPLSSGTYTVTANSRGTDLLGNPTTPTTWSFEVDATAPILVAASPANNSRYVPVDTVITLDLSEEIDPTTLPGRVDLLGLDYEPVDVSVQGRRITVKPRSPLKQRSTYRLQVNSVSDKVGNEFSTTIRFETDPGQFDYTQTAASANSPEAVAVGDVNGDGRDDVVMTNSFYFSPTTDYRVFIFFQQSSGKLGSAISLPTNATYVCRPTSVAIADVNGDGRKDLIIGESGCGIEIFLQNAAGELVSTGVAASPETHKIRAADVDGDGRTDIVGVGWGTNQVAVWKQAAAGTLMGPFVYKLDHSGHEDLDVGDVNGDGLPDVVVSSGQLDRSKALAILLQQVDGTFGNQQYRPIGGSGLATAVAVGDINGDGRADVLVGRISDYTIATFYHDESGTLSPLHEIIPGQQVEAIEITDLDGDGKKDIVFANGAGFGVYRQEEAGLGPMQWYPASISIGFNPQAITTGDINGDGYPDLVGAGIVYMLNRGTSLSASKASHPITSKATASKPWPLLRQLPAAP